MTESQIDYIQYSGITCSKCDEDIMWDTFNKRFVHKEHDRR